MEIKYLPEINEPQSNDYLIIQRGNLTARIKYSNLNIQVLEPTPTGDEEDMHIGANPPNNPTPGKLWGEESSNGLCIWIYQQNPISGQNDWLSETRQLEFSFKSGERTTTKQLLPLNHDYLMRSVDLTLNGIIYEGEYLDFFVNVGSDELINSETTQIKRVVFTESFNAITTKQGESINTLIETPDYIVNDSPNCVIKLESIPYIPNKFYSLHGTVYYQLIKK